MLKFLKINGLLFLFCWINILSLHAQNDTCIRFEDLPANAVYGRDAGQSAGDLAFNLKGVDVYLENFIYSNSDEIGFWNVSVTEDIFGNQTALDGQSLFISNINLKFDFTQLDLPVNGLCFNIVDGGGEENIAVNGQPIRVIPDFSDVPAEIAPGVFLEVSPLPNNDSNFPFNAQVCLRGKIEELLIGGQEFAFDNLCFYHEPCTLSDLKAEILNCDANNSDVNVYTVGIDFALPSTTNTNFDVYINNSFRGYFSTADLPLQLEQIRVLSDQEVFDVTVCVNDRPDCCVSVDLLNAGCPPECRIEGVELGAIECSFDGNYYTKIKVKGANLSGALHITNEAGEVWQGNADGSEAVSFPIPSQNYDKWIVCDPQYPNCCYTFDFDVPCPTCRIGPLQAEATECTDDGMFYIKLDFDHFTPTGQFYVFVNDEQYTAQAYANLPLRLGPFPGDGKTGYKILVRDASELCDQDIYLEPVACPPNNCEIGALHITERSCIDSDQFYFKLDFEHARTSGTFQLLLNQEVYKNYAYSDLPIRVGPLPADGLTDWHVLVQDAAGPCASDTKFEAVDCQPADCEIGPLHLSGPVCNDNGAFFFKLDFKYRNTSERFQVVLNGEVFESYGYDQLPVRVGPLPADGTTDWHVLVQDQYEHCASDTKFAAVDCQPKQCEIGDLKLSGPICTPGTNNEFYLQLDFDHWNTSETFELRINEETYETYAYADLPVRLGPFTTDASEIQWGIRVVDASDSCEQFSVVSGAVCNFTQCEIGALDISGPVCLDNGGFYFNLDFDYRNVSNTFQVVVNDEVFGVFDYPALPIRVGPLPADGVTDWLITVKDASQNCGQEAKLPPVSCYPDECRIGHLRISEPICGDVPGEFFFKLDFDHKNNTDAFKLLLNGELYEQYPYQELPVTVGPLPADGTTDWHILVEDLSGLCAEDGKLAAVNCNPETCKIGELKLSEAICTEDGQFFFEMNFEHENTTDKFQLFLNGDLYESYAYVSLPIKVGPLPVKDLKDWHVLVRDAGSDSNEHCASDAHLIVDCPVPVCEIGALKLSDAICTDDGKFFFEMNFEHANTSDRFKLFLNGELYESYAYADLPLKVGPLSPEGIKDWHILVRDAESTNNEHCASDAHLPVNCPTTVCEIGPLKLSEPICTDDGQFYFEMNFEHAHTSEKFQVLLNQEVYESYAYADLPVKIGPLPANTDLDWHVLVRDLSNTNSSPCASDAKLAAPVCPGGACKIGELHLVETYCTDDGQQFYTQLDFQHEGTSQEFQLFLNDEKYGIFAYEDLPLKLGPFNALIDLEWKLLVKDISGNCAADIHFSAPDCPGGGNDCNISNLQIERYPCIGGQFLVDLSFDIQDPGAKGYYVFTNGQISGPYSYEAPFITLGPFAGDGSTVYDFLVIDIDDPSCYGYYELGPVDCSNPCSIGEVFAEAHECGADGGFMVDVAFDYDKVGSSGFTIRTNGQQFGSFEYGQDFYTIGPLAGDGTTTYEIVVIDNDKPDCRNFTTIDPIDCLPCRIGALDYSVQCLENSKTFVLNLDFEYENPDSDRFTLAIGDQVVGSFLYTDLPLEKTLELPGSGELIVAVWDSENPSCAQKAEFSIPCCYLSELTVEAAPCENDGELWVDLDFDYYNVSNTFQVVYGPAGGTLEVLEFAYTDLPITLGPLPGQAATDWYFEVTDLGYFCQSSAELSTQYCDNDACAEWDQTPAGAYGPITGYDPGDLIDEEDGLQLSFAPANAANCDCAVFVTKASTFPAFSAGNGQVVLLDNSGAMISAPGYEIQQLSVDYYFTGNEVLLAVNDQPVVAAAHPLDLPAAIAPGVKLEVTASSNDGRNGRMVFSGAIYRLGFLSRGKWVLDNFCNDKTEKEDEVWPGDTNLDNVANHIDLLNIGLAYGQQGPPRTNAEIKWEAQQSENWSDQYFDSDLNYKHADANGDGRIDRADRGPIMEHYGLVHGPLPVFTDVPATENDPPLYVDFAASSSPIPVGGTFQVPIVFGTEAIPVEDIYGIAFTITFDPTVIDPASIEVVYPESWLGQTGEDLLTLDRTLEASGRIDVALTRINKVNVGGYGAIASLIGAIDDIAGKHTVVEITEVVAIRANEDRVPVNGIPTKVEFTEELKPEIGYIDLNASLNIFPNPTSGEVLITTRFNYPIEKIRILDGYGNPTGIEVAGKNRINLQDLPSGIYMLRIQLGKYTISRKVVKVN
ncbi:T9SS type A sorting domain-containing protein [Flavilitoribacter nigricans]|uniref:Secretion system C-terminal sorting domain-containing protein n=1 Tax=Flavilitoribacter nigricans (strain ATCC 23147 / DSM 23189 / NBRC 102662 / NCIMB 1420 / SS-2) TaxID=1122177 RepID=A0A2D0N0W5_FLAN2|nr:T9SS type A sorting domain-containing protein [Flavilitoribacter nigricans]PHN01789.1 hypothetical protein CRP01_35480 [Flavilitoribacter nigricans DSM 23189 = NBRC 102662]